MGRRIASTGEMRLAGGMAPPFVILVHGMYHQPRHLDSLADQLRERGCTVHVPRLHRGSLADDTAAVQQVVDRCDGAPIVVGHSYGGAVITGLTGIARLVYIAAFVPDTTESCASLGGPHALVNAWVRPHPSGGTFIPATYAYDLFYGDCSPEQAADAARNLVQEARGHGRGIPDRAAWKHIDSLYLVCAQDRALDPTLQAQMAQRCTRSVRLQASHSPYISMPEVVADHIMRSAPGPSARPEPHWG